MNFNSNFAGVNQAAGPSLGPSAAPAGLTPGRHGREQIEGVNMAALLDSVLQRKVKFDVAFSRALDSVGKLPKDLQFQQNIDHVEYMGVVAENTKERLTHYISATKVLTRSSHAMADDFKQFYEKAPELAFTTAALKNEVEMSKLDSEKHDKFAAHIADKVSARLELWIQSINDLQKRVVAREQARSIYLHYHSKIAEIRIDHEKLLASGKAESSSDTERRLRVRSTDAL